MLKDGHFAGPFNIVYAKAFQKTGHFGPWRILQHLSKASGIRLIY